MHVHSLLCFGAVPGDGNPALVIEGDDADTAARQAFARARNTTCVFIDQDGEDGIARVDFFYPHMRSPLCLHATLGVAAVLFARAPQAQTLPVRTAVNHQHLQLSRDGADYYVRIAAQPAPQVDVDDGALAALLDAPGFAARTRARVASIGSPKLLVEVADREVLYALRPDLAAIAAWGKAHGVNGLYVWCRRPDGAFEGRNFNHLDPRLEDSATGVAAGALAVALANASASGPAIDLDLRQGRMSGRDCLIRVRRVVDEVHDDVHDDMPDDVRGGALRVGGAATFA
ncbi:PhzF family phenazine biosynthesis protein [Massilia sp. 9096]|uniref:PhzF family phenazine biosynthesis protein n=1 Tax=Massilia sp. 9096 TaxID=1500894 RepID=UPI0009DD46EB|nr:PhzF family phenazine biosynthesis protein [Massilia sp. 9096]